MAFGYAQVPVLGLPCQLASSLLIGEIYSGLPMVEIILTGCRFLIWIGETILTAPIRQATDADDHWSRYLGSNQEKTFGPTISGLIFDHIGPERCLLWDSKREGGRPDTMRILKRVYNSWRAEGYLVYLYAPCWRLTRVLGSCLHHLELRWSEIMQGCKEAGIPAFGTLWDFVGVAFTTFLLRKTDDI